MRKLLAMKKILFIFIILCIAAGRAVLATVVPGRILVNSAGNMRAKSSTDAAIVMKVAQNDTVFFSEKEGDWYHLVSEDGTIETGWMFKSIAQVLTEPVAVTPAKPGAPGKILIISAGNVREKNNTDAPIVLKVAQNDTVFFNAIQGDWYRIVSSDGGMETGWVFKSLVKVLQEPGPALPVASPSGTAVAVPEPGPEFPLAAAAPATQALPNGQKSGLLSVVFDENSAHDSLQVVFTFDTLPVFIASMSSTMPPALTIDFLNADVKAFPEDLSPRSPVTQIFVTVDSSVPEKRKMRAVIELEETRGINVIKDGNRVIACVSFWREGEIKYYVNTYSVVPQDMGFDVVIELDSIPPMVPRYTAKDSSAVIYEFFSTWNRGPTSLESACAPLRNIEVRHYRTDELLMTQFVLKTDGSALDFPVRQEGRNFIISYRREPDFKRYITWKNPYVYAAVGGVALAGVLIGVLAGGGDDTPQTSGNSSNNGNTAGGGTTVPSITIQPPD